MRVHTYLCMNLLSLSASTRARFASASSFFFFFPDTGLLGGSCRLCLCPAVSVTGDAAAARGDDDAALFTVALGVDVMDDGDSDGGCC